MVNASFTQDDVEKEVALILASPVFARSRRLASFLRFTVNYVLTGRAEELKEYLIGSDVFERGPSFDPRTDTIVRTQAHRLRTVLTAYYEQEGRDRELIIEFSRGSYVPTIHRREHVEVPPPLPEVAAVPVSRPAKRWWVVGLLAAALLAAALLVAGFVIGRWKATAAAVSPQLAQLALPLFAEGTLDLNRGFAVLSPSGNSVIFPLLERSGERRIWFRSLRSGTAVPLGGTQNGYQPFWSPDETQIGFFAEGYLKIHRLMDGSVRNLCESPLGRGGAWGSDGTIIFSPRTSGAGIFKVSAAGGKPRPVTTVDVKSGELDHRWPELLADGEHFTYSARSTLPGKDGLYLGSLRGGSPMRLLPTSTQAHVAESAGVSYLLYVNEGAIRVRRLNVSAGRLEGPEIPVVDGVRYTVARGSAFSIAGDRLLAYQVAEGEQTEPVQLDRSGRVMRKLAPPGVYEAISLSPNGRRIAAGMAVPNGSGSDLWTSDVENPSFVRFTFEGGSYPVWTRDSNRVVFGSPRESLLSIFSRPVTGKEPPSPVWKSGHSVFLTDMSPDGRWLAVFEDNPETLTDILLLPYDWASGKVTGEPVPFRRSRYNERHAFFSPDGQWLAYISDETGRAEVYVESMPDNGETRRWKVSESGGSHPRWSRDGSTLYYLSPSGPLMNVPVRRAAGGISLGVPAPLFDARHFSAVTFLSPYSVSPDGQSFYALVSTKSPAPVTLPLLSNWIALINGAK
ncbi:MAG: hypothetical protein SGI92_02435 [Bryobacteraceae bacterium]|nr:hypothetical protein [Bryobacteraceae bacterium]